MGRVEVKVDESKFTPLEAWLMNDALGGISDGSEASLKELSPLYEGLSWLDTVIFKFLVLKRRHLVRIIHERGVACGKHHVLRRLKPWEKK